MRAPKGMKNAGSTVHIDVQTLRVGMFVHLDVGWMAHPFPLSSFRIASADQIATIQKLGVTQVRWSPEQSALAEATDLAQAQQDQIENAATDAAAESAHPVTNDESPEQAEHR